MSSLLSSVSAAFKKPEKAPKTSIARPHRVAHRFGMPIVQTNYTSKAIEIPEDFLKITPPDAQDITIQRIDFLNSTLPEYDGYYATVLDNVLSPSECENLLALAVESSPKGDWEPALLNAGIGREILAPKIRLCDR